MPTRSVPTGYCALCVCTLTSNFLLIILISAMDLKNDILNWYNVHNDYLNIYVMYMFQQIVEIKIIQ